MSFSTHTETLISNWCGLIQQSVACRVDHWNLRPLFSLSLKSTAAVPRVLGIQSNRRYANVNFTKELSCLLLKNNKAAREERQVQPLLPSVIIYFLTQPEPENIIYMSYFIRSSVSCPSLRAVWTSVWGTLSTEDSENVSVVQEMKWPSTTFWGHDSLLFILWYLLQWKTL